MPRIRIEPLGSIIEANQHESVMEAAERHGLFWPVGCARNGECTNCAMEVLSGLSRMTGMGRYERSNLIRQRGPRATDDARLRLACQARVLGDVVVYKRGVDPL
ncbi:MAG: 2Fe-2S iron-sulfur cluster-binding protein [Dehalococcoidia bacterium]|nr:(2Fe-2S)-binding protein [Dehalococcoidia bacterium]MCA9828885.1 (2Fe-2S)-binding protein [Dehalococcoidia bacterium]